MRSVEGQLRVSLSTVLIALLAALLFGGEWALRRIAEQLIATRLAHDAEAVAAAVTSPAGDAQLAPLPQIYRQPFSGHYFEVRFADGRLQRSRSLWDTSLEAPLQAPGARVRAVSTGPRQQELLLWSEGFSQGDIAFTVTAAEDMTTLTEAIGHYRLLGSGAALAVVGLLLAAQRFLLRRAFHRLDRVQTEIQRIAQGVEGRLDEGVPQEVQPLVAEINHLLDAWRDHLERSRNSLGNLAHALKGPLHLLSREDDEGERRAQLGRMGQIIERELLRARMAGRGVPGQHFRPRRDVADLVDAMAKLHADRGLRFTQRVEAPEQLPFEREDMLELLGNLVDNAAKWARSEVAVSLVHGLPLRLVVEDDGPGVEPSRIADLPHRGTRLDQSAPGHGLGLAIVQDIARLYGGNLAFDRSPELGGLRVNVRFQPPPVTSSRSMNT